MAWLNDPTVESARAFLAERLPNLALSRRALLIVGRCRIDYEGRAASTLDVGDRVILAKSDGTLVVHNPSGLKPVNWQPPGAMLSLATQGSLVLICARRKPPERLRLHFLSLQLVGDALLEDGAPIELRGTEFDLRDALRAKPELVEPGFKPWERERMTERGPMDLYGEDAHGRRVVVEVKRTRAGLAEATQLWRYVEKERSKRDIDVRGILAAPAISDRALLLLKDHGLEFLEIRMEELRPKPGAVPGASRTLLEFETGPREKRLK